jgi:lipoprotein-releasing system permease protein
VPALESLFGFHVMDPEVYYVTQIPSELRMQNVVAIALGALTLTALATVYPARRAARIAPAEALRYE